MDNNQPSKPQREPKDYSMRDDIVTKIVISVDRAAPINAGKRTPVVVTLETDPPLESLDLQPGDKMPKSITMAMAVLKLLSREAKELGIPQTMMTEGEYNKKRAEGMN